jgi:prepilin-type N-terminal cleavage/methylation domain-containing protein
MYARRQRGFTLIEMVISLVMLALLGAAAGRGLAGGALAFSGTADAMHTLGNLRYAGERLARELREIRRDPLAPSRYDISSMTATTLSFVRSDGIMVTLNSAPPLLTMAYSAPIGTHTLTDGVNSMNFSYYQADGSTPATGSSDVAFVEYDLVLERSGNSYPQRCRVALRNVQ